MPKGVFFYLLNILLNSFTYFHLLNIMILKEHKKNYTLK